MNEKNINIEFVNHASVLVNNNEVGILSDPWYSGSIFNKGWKLIYENKKVYIKEVLLRVNYIYISHEHPDHFNVHFFNDDEFKDIILNNKIKILFQETRDKRVKNFLINKGYEVIECSDNKLIKLNKNLSIKINKHDFYDSSILVKLNDSNILNINDSPLREKDVLKRFAKKIGPIDILLTQFSYAAWKGGKNENKFRKLNANEKINNILLQANIIKPKYIIPFASYIFFSNYMNFYMNDEINSPKKVYDELVNNKHRAIIMRPQESQNILTLKQDQYSIDFWENKFKDLKLNKLDIYDTKISLDNLNNEFLNYKKKFFKKNSYFFILILSKFKFLNLFQKINIFLIDHNQNYEFNIFSGLKIINTTNSHIKMHSESLLFIFKNEFGYDTLTVNGCFEASFKNFSLVSKTLALGSLNAMGINLNLNVLFKFNIIFLFLNKLKKFVNKSNNI